MQYLIYVKSQLVQQHDGEVVFCSQVIESKESQVHISEMHFRVLAPSAVYATSVNWITSKISTGVNIWQIGGVTVRVAFEVAKAPPACPIQCFYQWEPLEKTPLLEAPTLAHVNCFLPL